MLLAGAKIDTKHVRFNVTRQAMSEAQLTEASGDPNAQIFWWDGYMSKNHFLEIFPHQRINKLPAFDFLCYKSTTFRAFNKLRSMHKDVFNFFPLTFLLPNQFNDFKSEAERINSKQKEPATWIFKPRSGQCGNGIKIFTDPMDVSDSTKFNGIIQSYVDPFLLDGFKFDFRLYIFVATMKPFTCYIYKEGIARFCTQKYVKPCSENMENTFIHLTNTSVNVKNKDATNNYLQLFSQVLSRIKDPEMWNKIKRAAALSMVAQYHQIIEQIELEEIELRNAFMNSAKSTTLPPVDKMHRYFHILGIDIIINSKMEPIVLEMNDRPSMFVTFDIEKDLKAGLIRDALGLVTYDGTPPVKDSYMGKWEQILPIPNNPTFNKTCNRMMTESLSQAVAKLNRDSKLGKTNDKTLPAHNEGNTQTKQKTVNSVLRELSKKPKPPPSSSPLKLTITTPNSNTNANKNNKPPQPKASPADTNQNDTVTTPIDNNAKVPVENSIQNPNEVSHQIVDNNNVPSAKPTPNPDAKQTSNEEAQKVADNQKPLPGKPIPNTNYKKSSNEEQHKIVDNTKTLPSPKLTPNPNYKKSSNDKSQKITDNKKVPSAKPTPNPNAKHSSNEEPQKNVESKKKPPAKHTPNLTAKIADKEEPKNTPPSQPVQNSNNKTTPKEEPVKSTNKFSTQKLTSNPNNQKTSKVDTSNLNKNHISPEKAAPANEASQPHEHHNTAPTSHAHHQNDQKVNNHHTLQTSKQMPNDENPKQSSEDSKLNLTDPTKSNLPTTPRSNQRLNAATSKPKEQIPNENNKKQIINETVNTNNENHAQVQKDQSNLPSIKEKQSRPVSQRQGMRIKQSTSNAPPGALGEVPSQKKENSQNKIQNDTTNSSNALTKANPNKQIKINLTPPQKENATSTNNVSISAANSAGSIGLLNANKRVITSPGEDQKTRMRKMPQTSARSEVFRKSLTVSTNFNKTAKKSEEKAQHLPTLNEFQRTSYSKKSFNRPSYNRMLNSRQ